ncbi:Uncharacterised protein [Bordetella pertussis]|nr:Uncharacterised protein [Bordetella pertussis]
MQRLHRRLVGDDRDTDAHRLQALDGVGRSGLFGGQHQVGFERQHALDRHRPVVADARQLRGRLRVQAGQVVADQAAALAQRIDDFGNGAAQRDDALRRRGLRRGRGPGAGHRQ